MIIPFESKKRSTTFMNLATCFSGKHLIFVLEWLKELLRRLVSIKMCSEKIRSSNLIFALCVDILKVQLARHNYWLCFMFCFLKKKFLVDFTHLNLGISHLNLGISKEDLWKACESKTCERTDTVYFHLVSVIMICSDNVAPCAGECKNARYI